MASRRSRPVGSGSSEQRRSQRRAGRAEAVDDASSGIAAGARHGASHRVAWHAALLDPPLAESDPEIARLIADENRREHDTMRLIASENYASRAVMEATGSVLTNKYSEGYAHKRYYEGQQVVDQVEELAIARLKRLFGVGGRARQRAALLGQPREPRRVLRLLRAGRHRSWASPCRPAGT